jgi:hypothetical protein
VLKFNKILKNIKTGMTMNHLKLTLFIIIAFSSFQGGAVTSKACPGDDGYLFTNNRDKNPIAGGFVSNGADVSESSFVAPTAAVCGSALVRSSRLLGKTRVKGNAYVENSVLMGEVIIEGEAYVNKSTLRGYHHLKSGNHEGVKAYKPQNSSQKQSASDRAYKKEKQKKKLEAEKAFKSASSGLIRLVNGFSYSKGSSLEGCRMASVYGNYQKKCEDEYHRVAVSQQLEKNHGNKCSFYYSRDVESKGNSRRYIMNDVDSRSISIRELTSSNVKVEENSSKHTASTCGMGCDTYTFSLTTYNINSLLFKSKSDASRAKSYIKTIGNYCR